MSDRPMVYAVATMDTKGQELQFVADRLRQLGVAVTTVDVGTGGPPQVPPDVSRQTVLGEQAMPADADRGRAIAVMGQRLARFLSEAARQGQIAGVIGIGGSGGTSLICTALRELPIGLPKVMVSTVASGNTAPFVGHSDILMLYSVVDVAGLNRVSRPILANAAAAMAGMVRQGDWSGEADLPPAVGMTMFGVTTPCVTRVRHRLEAAGWDCLVFHATGAGGRAMEQLVASGMIGGVLDITTTEVADQIAGGIMPAGPHRFDRLVRAGIPLVLSLGAVDMVNFGPLDTVPAQYRHRLLHQHNPQITLMRTNAEENRRIAAWIADKLAAAKNPWTLLIPEHGVSALDAPGQPFYDPQVDAVLFDELERRLSQVTTGAIRRLPYHINDPQFADALAEAFESACRHQGLWPVR
ncbi:MAG: hypothetical protein KatS3mg111_1525 [Pirellulaceae bacterium]|nr:MAG: hypothetical protein KatS3mg111_1525 [Pirellulaceae bacterium]